MLCFCRKVSIVWKKLVSRTCPESIRINLGTYSPSSPDVRQDVDDHWKVLVRERAEMTNLIVILKMPVDPKTHLVIRVAIRIYIRMFREHFFEIINPSSISLRVNLKGSK